MFSEQITCSDLPIRQPSRMFDYRFLDPISVNTGEKKYEWSEICSDFDRLSALGADLDSGDASSHIEDLVDLGNAEPSQLLNHLATDEGHRRPQELRVVFTVATHCLAALARKSLASNRLCQALVESLINDHLGSVYRALDPANNGAVVKSALRCLAAMASCDATSAKTLLHAVDFSARRWQALARRRNPADQDDIRHCCVQLGVAFLVGAGKSGSTVVRAFLERGADFAGQLLERLDQDKPATLLLLLPALTDRLLASGSGVSKTQKARLFGRRQLSCLARLLAYSAPLQQAQQHRRPGAAKADDSTIGEVDDEGGTESSVSEAALAVREAAYRLLRGLGASRRDGILFRRGENPLLCHLLVNCLASRLVASGRYRRLAASIGRRCPELAARLTGEALEPLLPPRPGPSWLAAADCLAALWGVDDGDAGEAEEEGDAEAARIALAAVVRDAAMVAKDDETASFTMKGLLLPNSDVQAHLASGLTLADTGVSTDTVAAVRSRCRRIRRLLAQRLAFVIRAWRICLHSKGGRDATVLDAALAEAVIAGDPLGLVDKATEYAEAAASDAEAEALVAKALAAASALDGGGVDIPKLLTTTAAAPAAIDIDEVAAATATFEDQDPDEDFEAGGVVADQLPACVCDLADLPDRRRTAAEQMISPDAETQLSPSSWQRFCRKSFQPKSEIVCLVVDAAAAGCASVLTPGHENVDDAIVSVLALAMDHPALRRLLLSNVNADVSSNCPRLLDAVLRLLASLARRLSAPPESAFAIRLSGALMLHYGASLSGRDQLIIAAVHQLRRALPGDLSQCCWSGRLAECRRFQPDLSSRLFAAPPPAGILAQLEPRRVLYTAVHFPLDRAWLSHPKPLLQPARPGLYDPCWLLPLLCRLLPAGLEASAAIRHHCLSLAIASLASHSERIRLLGLTVLANLYRGCDSQSQRFPERDQACYLIGVVRSTLTSANRRLPCLIALFLARCAEALLKPQQRMYGLLWRFLTARSALPLNAAPELWRFLMSDHVDHRVERQWLLQLFAQGARDLEDYRLLERSFAVKTLLAIYPALDGTAKCLTLRLLCRLASLRPAAVSMVNRHQLIVWLSGVVCNAEARQLAICRRLVRVLWRCLLGCRPADSLPVHFVGQMRCLLQLPAFAAATDCAELHCVRQQVGEWTTEVDDSAELTVGDS